MPAPSAGMTTEAYSPRLQRREQILHHVVGVLQPAGEPQQAIADAELGARRRREALVRGGRGMRDQALGVAEIIADADEPERILDAKRRSLAALDLEGDQGRAALHLPAHDLGLRMVGPAGIDQA